MIYEKLAITFLDGKAFDNVNYHILFDKLEEMPVNLLSHRPKRQQRAKVTETLSDFAK